MASMFDQYENDFQRMVPNKPSTSPFDEDEPPMFQKVKANFQPADKITHLAISNDYKVLALANNTLLRIHKKQKNQQETLTEIDMNRIVPGVKLVGLFLDPSAEHLLISFSTELLYLNRKQNKPKPVSKMRSHEVTAVAWHPHNSGILGDSTTKPILFGTAKGQIFETQINAETEAFLFQTSGNEYCKLVFDMGQRDSLIITGLEYHRMEKSDHYFVIATTQDRLYHFVGKVNNPDDRPFLQGLFNKYISATIQESFISLPGRLETSRIQLYRPYIADPPSALCWQTETGIYYAQIDHSSTDQLLSRTKMYGFPSNISPISFLMTEFHILLLYSDHIIGISLLSQELVFKDYFSEIHGPLVNICKDYITGKILIYAEKAIFRYEVYEEDRHVWQIFADKGDYEEAKKFCKDDAFKRDKVLRMQADFYFSKKEYEMSAEYYAETQASFEKIALKFLEVQNNEALKLFLKKKLSGLKSGDKAQTTMLVLWIMELLLSQLVELKTKGKSNTKQYALIQEELNEFLAMDYSRLYKYLAVKSRLKRNLVEADPLLYPYHPITRSTSAESLILKKNEHHHRGYDEDCIHKNKQAVYGLMSSHGDQENMIKLAKSTNDFERVINHFINKGDCLTALKILGDQPKNKKLWYQYIPSLIQEEPIQTLAFLRMMGKDLEPIRILPSLLAESSSRPDEMIKYLEFCINEQNCQEQAVHNFLLSLLVQYRPEKLMTYLTLQGEELSMVNYDVRYGVRICRQYDRKEACVKLSMLLGLWESAVDLALTVNTQLAVQTALQSHCSPCVQRKLWLNIAKHVVKEEQQNNIAQVMSFLKQCDLIKIEDILPFFPNYTTVDYFKDAICSSLQEYNQHIEDLKEEMQDATKSAEIIRNEIQSFRTRHTVIEWNTSCSICNLQLLLRPFYAFPCGHFFHSDCLSSELKPLLPPNEQETLVSLMNQEESQMKVADKEKVRNSIDTILAAQCLFCGDLMIDLIDKPFIADEDYERLKKEWE